VSRSGVDFARSCTLSRCFFDAAGRTAFVESYGPIPKERLLRARVLALFLCAILAAYGRHEQNEAVEREALAGLERTLVD